MNSELLTVTLEKLTYGGDALGRLPDGRAVFVPFALPGETVRIRLREEKRGHGRAELVEVVRAAAERIAPRCRHFGICGGCHYQHLPYELQLKAKTEILADQLRRIGKIDQPPVQAMVASPQAWNYRNHVQFHLTRQGKLGYVDAASRDVVPVAECHLPEEALNALWPELEFDPELGLERVALRLGADGETLLVLESDSPEPPALELEADLSVVHVTGDETLVMAGDDHFTIRVKDRSFQVSAGSFFQVNTAMAAGMVDHLLERLPVEADATLLDVYCGVGLFSAFFAPRVARLIGIELSPSSCRDFAVNLDEFENVELYEAPAEAVLPALDVRPQAVLLDPPRAGLDKRVVDALLAQEPARIAYVSCDPSTLARDAARLIAGGYALVEVTPFDLFPQTSSIESISLFARA
jgi:23S rRNA (uracil1939-C5)-methyltransferase